jgi:hypothetical protein
MRSSRPNAGQEKKLMRTATRIGPKRKSIEAEKTSGHEKIKIIFGRKLKHYAHLKKVSVPLLLGMSRFFGKQKGALLDCLKLPQTGTRQKTSCGAGLRENKVPSSAVEDL